MCWLGGEQRGKYLQLHIAAGEQGSQLPGHHPSFQALSGPPHIRTALCKPHSGSLSTSSKIDGDDLLLFPFDQKVHISRSLDQHIIASTVSTLGRRYPLIKSRYNRSDPLWIATRQEAPSKTVLGIQLFFKSPVLCRTLQIAVAFFFREL